MEQKKGITIYLPSDEQVAQMIEDGWQKFVKQANEAGLNFGDDTAGGLLKDAFVGGWSYGWNDGYGIIKGQLDAVNLEHS